VKRVKTKNIGEIFRQRTPIDRALAKAVSEALRQHKRAGNPVASWQGGKVVWIQPKDIPDF
jgi:hypothetical protein